MSGQNISGRSRLAGLMLLLTGLAGPALAADYTVSVEPSYPPDQARDVYRPLLEYLSKATGQRFVLHYPSNYHLLWRDIRNNTPVDFAFEEAQFTDYRAQRFGFEPLVRTIEPSTYALIAQPEVADQGSNALIGRLVVSMPSPSMGYALLVELFRNPISQPEVLSTAASWRDGVEMIFAGEADAAMVPMYIAQLYPNLVEMHNSRSLPGRAFSAAGTVPDEVKAAVRDALLKLNEDESLYTVINEIGTTQFVPTSADEFKGNQNMLRGFFGYTEPTAAAQ
jgi:ABC-type phosphate/phosphonate transport system substrate-binding protein